jgi:hypothetical protein
MTGGLCESLREDATDLLTEGLSPGGGAQRALQLAAPYMNWQRDAITAKSVCTSHENRRGRKDRREVYFGVLGELAVIVSTVLESAGTAPPSVAMEQPDESPTEQP